VQKCLACQAFAELLVKVLQGFWDTDTHQGVVCQAVAEVKVEVLDILTKSVMDSYDACMLHVRRSMLTLLKITGQYTLMIIPLRQAAYILPSLSCNSVPLHGFACFLT
jgi:hypothetical protein